MSGADLDRLAATAIVITLRAGQSIIEEGGIARHFFTLTSGTARLFKSLPDARQQIVSFAGRGDLLGLAYGARYTTGAEAVDEVRLCRFSRQGLHDLADAFPDLKRRLLSITSNELVLAQEQMLLLGRKKACERLASFLVMRAGRTGDADAGTMARPAGGWVVSLPMRRVDIADYLGMTIETVSRNLTLLKARGLIGVNTLHQVAILDLPALECLAAGQ